MSKMSNLDLLLKEIDEHAKNKIHAISVGVCSHKKWWEFYFL